MSSVIYSRVGCHNRIPIGPILGAHWGPKLKCAQSRKGREKWEWWPELPRTPESWIPRGQRPPVALPNVFSFRPLESLAREARVEHRGSGGSGNIELQIYGVRPTTILTRSQLNEVQGFGFGDEFMPDHDNHHHNKYIYCSTDELICRCD